MFLGLHTGHTISNLLLLFIFIFFRERQRTEEGFVKLFCYCDNQFDIRLPFVLCNGSVSTETVVPQGQAEDNLAPEVMLCKCFRETHFTLLTRL